MKHYKISDFIKGLSVYHKSNKKIKMVVIGTNPDSNEVTCRWIDNDGKILKQEFFFEELMNASDVTSIRSYY